MSIVCWIPKATNTLSECVIFIALPWKQRLHESASISLPVLLFVTSLLEKHYLNGCHSRKHLKMWHKEVDENTREATAKLILAEYGNTYAITGTFSHTPWSDSENGPGKMLNFAMLHCLNLCPKRQPGAQLTPIIVIHIRSQNTRCDNRNYIVIYFTRIQKDRKSELENVTTASLPCPFVFMIYHHPIISLSLM